MGITGMNTDLQVREESGQTHPAFQGGSAEAAGGDFRSTVKVKPDELEGQPDYSAARTKILNLKKSVYWCTSRYK